MMKEGEGRVIKIPVPQGTSQIFQVTEGGLPAEIRLTIKTFTVEL